MPTHFENYIPPTHHVWTGRVDSPTSKRFHQHVQCAMLSDLSIPQGNETSFAILGFVCDEGVRRNEGRQGAAEGPKAFREYLGKLPVQDLNYACYDVGDIQCFDHDLEGAQQALSLAIAHLHQNHYQPIIIGGGHEVALGHFMGLKLAYPNKHIAIINLDAHFDLRTPQGGLGSSGTPFYQIAKLQDDAFDYTCLGIQQTANTADLFQVAKDLNTQFILAETLHEYGVSGVADILENTVERADILYVTCCLDVLAACVAPGVSAPQPLGLPPALLLQILKMLAQSGKAVAFDIAELAPSLDVTSQTTLLAASVASFWMENIFLQIKATTHE